MGLKDFHDLHKSFDMLVWHISGLENEQIYKYENINTQIQT